MRVAVVGLQRKKVEIELTKEGIKNDRKNPEIVISFGGDGTALYSERVYPGKPKFLIKHSKFCQKCKYHDYKKVLRLLKKRKYKIVEMIKLEGMVNQNKNKKLVALNEIGVHNRIPTRAIRFQVKINGKFVSKELIGDGLIVSTPFGSSAYFYSITKKTFKKGIGIAFNNIRDRIKPIIVSDKSNIKVKILRDSGLMTSDNSSRMITLKAGDLIEIKRSREKARIVELLGKRRIYFS